MMLAKPIFVPTGRPVFKLDKNVTNAEDRYLMTVIATASNPKFTVSRVDIDRPGKDSYRHREAGAFEVLIASRHRLALMREFERDTELTVHQLLAQLQRGVDWVLVEGFRGSDLHKIEVWRAEAGHPVLYPDDEFMVAIATDDAARLPAETRRPVLDLNRPAAVADWLLDQGERFEYVAERYGA